jgi:hypothetical protein
MALLIVVLTGPLAAEPKPLGEEPAGVTYTTISDAGKPFELAEGFELIRPPSSAAAVSGGQPLLLQDGRLFCAVLEGGVVKGTFSEDRGRTWSPTQLVDKHPNEKVKPGRPASLQAHDGTIWVFYFGYVRYNAKNPAECDSDVWAVRSADGGKTWTDRTKAFDGYVGMLQGAIQTKSGNLLVPLCHFHEPTRFIGGCAVSTDNGKAWQFAGPVDIGPEADAKQRNPYNGGALEPTVVELRDGRILMLLRTITGRMWRCESTDGGLTWTQPQPSEFSCGGTIYITRLLSGRLALVWNPANWDAPEAKKKSYPHGYGNASIALSDDDGATWSTPIHFAKSDRTVHSLVTSTGKDGPLLITLPGRALLHVDEKRLLAAGAATVPTLP